jgi:hypothetical protein
LDKLGIIIHEQSGAILCVKCCCLLKISSLVSHAYRKHKVDKAKALVKKVLHILPLHINELYLKPGLSPISPIEGI